MGQLLYKNLTPKTKMRTPEEVTQTELDEMARIHKATSFTKEEAMGMVNLCRAYVNPNTPDCLACSSNLRDAKNALCSFYLLHKDTIQARLNAPAPVVKTNGKKKAN